MHAASQQHAATSPGSGIFFGRQTGQFTLPSTFFLGRLLVGALGDSGGCDPLLTCGPPCRRLALPTRTTDRIDVDPSRTLYHCAQPLALGPWTGNPASPPLGGSTNKASRVLCCLLARSSERCCCLSLALPPWPTNRVDWADTSRQCDSNREANLLWSYHHLLPPSLSFLTAAPRTSFFILRFPPIRFPYPSFLGLGSSCIGHRSPRVAKLRVL